MQQELKSCPFCGSTPLAHKFVNDRVACQNDSCWIYKVYIAVPDWNTRTKPEGVDIAEGVKTMREYNEKKAAKTIEEYFDGLATACLGAYGITAKE